MIYALISGDFQNFLHFIELGASIKERTLLFSGNFPIRYFLILSSGSTRFDLECFNLKSGSGGIDKFVRKFWVSMVMD